MAGRADGFVSVENDPERTSRRCADSHTDDAGGRGNLLLKI